MNRILALLLQHAQLPGAVAAVLLTVLLPPAHGQMLLVPLSAQGNAALVERALTDGAMLVQAGPVRGSVVVRGDRDRIAGDMLSRGILVLSAAPAGCAAPGGSAA